MRVKGYEEAWRFMDEGLEYRNEDVSIHFFTIV